MTVLFVRIYNKIINNASFISFNYSDNIVGTVISSLSLWKKTFCFNNVFNNSVVDPIESICFYRLLALLIIVSLSIILTQKILINIPKKYLNENSINIDNKWLMLFYFPTISMILLLNNEIIIVLFLSTFINIVISLIIIDIKLGYLPDVLTYSLLWLGLLYQIGSEQGNVVSAIYAVIVSYLAIMMITTLAEQIRQRPQMGRGDFKLIAACAAWLGIADLPLFFAVAASLGGVYYIAVYVFSSNKPGNSIPFGPAIIISASYWLFCPLIHTFMIKIAL